VIREVPISWKVYKNKIFIGELYTLNKKVCGGNKLAFRNMLGQFSYFKSRAEFQIFVGGECDQRTKNGS